MDGERFDAIAKSLAKTSRRRALGLLAGGTLAGVLGRFGIAPAAAAQVESARRDDDGREGDRCRRDNDCRGELECCNRRCRNTRTDARNCGGCGTRCADREECLNGGCFRTCGSTIPNRCSLDACGDTCGCNPTASGIGVCQSTAQDCRVSRACQTDKDCNNGLACIASGCCAGKPRICARPCAQISPTGEARIRELEAGSKTIEDFKTLDER